MSTTSLWEDLYRRLSAVGDPTATAAARRAQAALDTARSEVEAINRDNTRTPEWKREQRQRILAQRRAEAEAAGREAEAAVERLTRRLEERTAWPRSDGTDADREARLANARSDLAQLLSTVPAGRRAERAAFAARNGTPRHEGVGTGRALLRARRVAEHSRRASRRRRMVRRARRPHNRTAPRRRDHPG